MPVNPSPPEAEVSCLLLKLEKTMQCCPGNRCLAVPAT